MTREEQIIKASHLYAKHQQKPFMDGALWADKHPKDVQLAYKQGYKDAIDKACEFLKSYRQETPDGTGYIAGIVNDETIKDFRKYMEEQK